MPTVAVFGAGIAGLTVAHELRCRGYDVKVYEKRTEREVGGKARTQYWNSSSGGGELRGEHGFRFFPAFYALLDETLKRIPLDPSTENLGDPASWLNPTLGPNVFSNLIEPEYQAFGRDGQRITRHKTITLSAGRTHQVSFDFETSHVARISQR